MEAFSVEDHSAILARSQELTQQHREYLGKHPELTQLLHDFLTNCLVNKPDDCFQFCNEYFEGFKGGDGAGDVADGWGYSNCRALLLVGPRGVGKHWFAKKLVKMYDDKFGIAIYHTSRAPRDGEKDGADYIFTSREAMEIGMAGGEFVISSESEGELFGIMASRIDSVAATRRVCIIPCDLDGAAKLRKALAGRLMPRCILINTNKEQLEKRLKDQMVTTEDMGPILNELEEFQGAVEEKCGKGFFDLVHTSLQILLAVIPKAVCTMGLMLRVRLQEAMVDYDDDDLECIAGHNLDDLLGFCVNQDWQVKIDEDLSKAALKIQGQARRRRDAHRVKKIKKEKDPTPMVAIAEDASAGKSGLPPPPEEETATEGAAPSRDDDLPPGAMDLGGED